MQFALMIYHTQEEFDMRKGDYSDPHLGAWRAYYKALVDLSKPESTSAPMHLKCPRQEQRCALGKESAAYRTDRMLIRRSSSQDSSSWNSLPLTLPSNGPHGAREHP